MIGDLICDRKDGEKYSAREFYWAVMDYRDRWPEWADEITRAMDAGEEPDVMAALCKYVDEAGWNAQVKDYICSVKWLEDDPEDSFKLKVTFPKDRVMDEQGRTEKQPFTFATWVAYETERDADGVKHYKREPDDELQRRLLSQAWTLAARMGWELWMPLDVEIPLADLTLHMGPKDEQGAREIQVMLDRARQRKEAFSASMEVTAEEAAGATL